MKLFDRYKDVEVFNGRLEEQKKKLAAYREARKYRFVPDLVGGKTQYDENVAQIRSLQVELDNLTSEQGITRNWQLSLTSSFLPSVSQSRLKLQACRSRSKRYRLKSVNLVLSGTSRKSFWTNTPRSKAALMP